MSVPPTLRRGLIYLLPLALPGDRARCPDRRLRSARAALAVLLRSLPEGGAAPVGDAPIRIVDIDDKSLNKLGQWPWPRSVVAQLVDRLREAGAAVVAFDIDFAEPDRTSPKSLLPLLAQNGVGAAEAEKLLAAVPDPDRRLAEAIGALPVVTGFILTDHGDARPPASKAGFAFVGDDPLGHVDRFPAAVANLPGLEDAAAGNGFLNQSVDWDHVVRRVPLVLRLGDKPYPSLAAETLRLALGARSYLGRAAGANAEKSFGEKTGLDGNPHRTSWRYRPMPPVGCGCHYAVPRRDRFVPAADVLAGNFDPALGSPITSCWSAPRPQGSSTISRPPRSHPTSLGWRSTPSCSRRSCRGRFSFGPIGRSEPNSCSRCSSGSL